MKERTKNLLLAMGDANEALRKAATLLNAQPTKINEMPDVRISTPVVQRSRIVDNSTKAPLHPNLIRRRDYGFGRAAR